MTNVDLNSMVKIDTDLISSWDFNKALKKVFKVFSDSKNIKGASLYQSVDEKDVMELVYYILKYSKGKKNPKSKDIESLAAKLTFQRVEVDNDIGTNHYALHNGEMTDLHMSFFLENLFNPYTEKLYEDYGFTHHLVKYLKFFFLYQFSLTFTMDDVKKMIDEVIDDEDKAVFLIMFTKFIECFSGETDLNDFTAFQKGVSRKPIIKISENEYVFFWHWFRTSAILNFHYLLSKDESYKKHRGDVFEEITVSLFKHHLKIDTVYGGVTYKGGEIDVLVDTDDAIILIECKSGTLYEDYKLGTIDDKVVANIDSITGKAKVQLHKAKAALLNKKDMRHQNSKLNIDTSKKILLLNVCFEFPVGRSNKDKNEEVIVLSLVDLMMIIDLMEDKLLGESRLENIIEYLILRRKTLDFATDDEVVIAITLLYFKHLDSLIENDSLGMAQINSSESVSTINEFYSFLSHAKIIPDSKEREVVRKNYKGFLREYVVRDE